ncbi:MAG: hypothetical protein DRO46_00730 [Candidatus Hecatellales archaeon]|nr:MAG: hypothetical protein DRO46_00730 [Candidatus Hecatellales archaeon]
MKPFLSLGLTSAMPSEWLDWSFRRCEALGFQGLWIGEDIGRPGEIFTLTGLAVLSTAGIPVGIGLTSPFIRNLSTLARAAYSLHEASKGRFRLGLGVGGKKDLESLGVKVDKPLKAMREALTLLRSLWKGESLTFQSEFFQFKNYKAKFKAEIPVFLGARGEKMLRLAGEEADGALVSGPRGYLEKALAFSREGLNCTLTQPKKLVKVAWLPTILTTSEEDLTLARKVAATILLDTPSKVFAYSKMDLGKVEEVKRVAASSLREAASLVDRETLEALTVYGDSEEVCSKLRELAALGFDEVVFGPPYGKNWEKAVEEVAKAWLRK